VLIEGPDGRPAAALPAYLKQHSQGEYVFDQGWADAWERAGGDYYPKLQISVPFTPATGPRLLCGDHPELALPLLRAAEAVVDQNGLSSAHATFIAPEQVPVFEEAGWLCATICSSTGPIAAMAASTISSPRSRRGGARTCARSAPPRRRACGSSG
jgi:predicted N-acyltransferase